MQRLDSLVNVKLVAAIAHGLTCALGDLLDLYPVAGGKSRVDDSRLSGSCFQNNSFIQLMLTVHACASATGGANAVVQSPQLQ